MIEAIETISGHNKLSCMMSQILEMLRVTTTSKHPPPPALRPAPRPPPHPLLLTFTGQPGEQLERGLQECPREMGHEVCEPSHGALGESRDRGG